MENGEYIQDTLLTMNSYDAGTDSGTSFESADEVTDPAAPITRITDAPLGNGNGVIPAIATIRFTKRN